MKVKEKMSKDFVKDIVLKEKGNLSLIESKFPCGDIHKSSYILYDNKYNESYIKVDIPDFTQKDIYKDIFLKYQTGVRRFLVQFFDVLVGEKDTMSSGYKTEQVKDLTYEQTDNVCDEVILKVLKDGSWFGSIGFFCGPEVNKQLAENFINYFEGKPLDYSWKEIFEKLEVA